MAFEISKSGYSQIDPLFAQGFNPEQGKYHNIGQLQTPYQGKRFGSSGDYGPPQRTKYYTDYNRNYPYVLDANFNAREYLPGEGCCFRKVGYSPCYENKYPNIFIPPNYFSPQLQHPSGHARPINDRADEYISKQQTTRERYPGRSLSDSDKLFRKGRNREDFRKLIVAYPEMKGGKNFYPFDNRY